MPLPLRQQVFLVSPNLLATKVNISVNFKVGLFLPIVRL